ncbi:MAG: hypothetical protein WC421_04900 [Elusimicrobiales bacterium]
MKNRILLAVMGLLIGAAAYFPLRLLADDVTATPSTISINAKCNYNDEFWQATDFYQLTGSGSSYVYSHKNPPDLSKVVYCDGDACIPADIVITGWNVTGHMHFAAGS